MTDLSAALDEARRVLSEESNALVHLRDMLGEDFARAVDTIAAADGRVIVTGMGKSGHIGAKIAATLASTGTPSFFLHPGEASHGDLGMITRQDVVVAISHGGGTRELGDVLAYCNRFKIPLIAMTSKADSMLGQAADVLLLTGVDREACPLNLAPMTSTTVTLALGDALAAALMHISQFEPDDFFAFHPGGSLGSKLSRVATLMHQGDELPIVPAGTLMDQALIVMSEKRLGVVMVLDDQGHLEGIITDGDLRRHMGDGLLSTPVEEVLTRNPKTIEVNASAQRAVAMMQDLQITSLVVTDEESNKPVGLLHIHDCLRAGIV